MTTPLEALRAIVTGAAEFHGEPLRCYRLAAEAGDAVRLGTAVVCASAEVLDDVLRRHNEFALPRGTGGGAALDTFRGHWLELASGAPHTDGRRVVQAAMDEGGAAQRDSSLRALARAVVDEIAVGVVDLATDLCAPLTEAFVTEYIGIPRDVAVAVVPHLSRVAAAVGADVADETAEKAALALAAQLREVLRGDRLPPGSVAAVLAASAPCEQSAVAHLANVLVAALPAVDAVGICVAAAVAGGIPDEQDVVTWCRHQLVRDPVQFVIPRRALTPTTVASETVTPGTPVLLLPGVAHHGATARHGSVAGIGYVFGHGTHSCPGIGATLGLCVATITALRERDQTLTRAHHVEWVVQPALRRLKRLAVTVC